MTHKEEQLRGMYPTAAQAREIAAEYSELAEIHRAAGHQAEYQDCMEKANWYQSHADAATKPEE